MQSTSLKTSLEGLEALLSSEGSAADFCFRALFLVRFRHDRDKFSLGGMGRGSNYFSAFSMKRRRLPDVIVAWELTPITPL